MGHIFLFLMKYSSSIIFLIFIIFFKATAQNIPISEVRQQFWLGYITDLKFNDKWSLWNDTHWVPGSFFILRTGITKQFKKQGIKTTLGYGHLWAYPPSDKKTFRPEHRLWGQTTLSYGHKKPWRFLHRLRYEARFRGTIIDDFLINEFNFNYRFRYLFQTKLALNSSSNQQSKWFLSASNEFLFNLGKEIKGDFRLDQNRISFGAGYEINNMTFQLAYVNQLIESNLDYSFRMNHNIQLLVFQNFKW